MAFFGDDGRTEAAEQDELIASVWRRQRDEAAERAAWAAIQAELDTPAPCKPDCIYCGGTGIILPGWAAQGCKCPRLITEKTAYGRWAVAQRAGARVHYVVRDEAPYAQVTACGAHIVQSDDTELLAHHQLEYFACKRCVALMAAQPVFFKDAADGYDQAGSPTPRTLAELGL